MKIPREGWSREWFREVEEDVCLSGCRCSGGETVGFEGARWGSAAAMRLLASVWGVGNGGGCEAVTAQCDFV